MEKKEIISRALQTLSIDALNPMQLAVLSGDARQIILLGPTGSGKTLAFTIAMLKTLDSPGLGLQALILAPSRELALQTGSVVRAMARGYKTEVFYGGHPMQAETDSIKGAVPDIVVATPGRLADHLSRHTLSMAQIRAFILDEYDKALELGFQEQIKKIARAIPKRRRLTLLSSATRPAEIPDFINMDDAEVIDFTERTESPRNRMDIVNVISPLRDKLETLRNLLLTLSPDSRVIIFVNHRESAERVYNDLKKTGFPVGLYHGGLEQRERELALDLFANGSTPILVSTDLASRGLDIEAVDSVIHYHHATSPEAWTHRNGRTARVDSEGTIYVITSEGEDLPDFENYDRELSPAPTDAKPTPARMATLFFNAGKREKISRGDIAGFLMQQSGLKPDQVGKINIKDHWAIAAIPAQSVKSVLENLKGKKLKNKSIRVSTIHNA